MLATLLASFFARPPQPSVLTIPIAEAAYIAPAPDYSTTTLRAYAEQVANTDGLNVAHFTATIDCEDPDWIPDQQSEYVSADGTREQSFGIAQINIKAHPEVSYEEAVNPYFSIRWMANEWRNGNAHEWTCWRIHFGP